MEWKKLIEHLPSKFEDKYLFEDGLNEERVDEFIISVRLSRQLIMRVKRQKLARSLQIKLNIRTFSHREV